MIFIVSDSACEAALLAGLCEQRSWPCQICTSLADFDKQLARNSPCAVVVRQRFQDGHSDDIFASLKQEDADQTTKTIVLVSAAFSIRQEVRQVMLGADCVLRDPVKTEVLLEYLAKYRAAFKKGIPPAGSLSPHFDFAGAQVFPHEYRLARRGRTVRVAPQEVDLLQLLCRSVNKVAPYSVLYSDLFNQRFTGDTANCRVLLGKVTASFRQLNVNLRSFIEVIPKSGYLYSVDGQNPVPSAKGDLAKSP